MTTIIAQIVKEFTTFLWNFFSQDEILCLEKTEKKLLEKTKEVVSQLLTLYYEEIDRELYQDKLGRKKLGYVVQRKGDSRSLLTRCGKLNISRTYYYNQNTNSYEYLLDQIMGIEKSLRVSDGMSADLVKASLSMSYKKSCEHIADDMVSSQTVMHKIRRCITDNKPESEVKIKVPVLHIDADEAHIKLRKGKRSQVPLICIYEGFEKIGKRSTCKNIFHISEYGKSPDDLWEQALTEAEKRYDLSETKIYIHGDGE